jgi:hypothetical protein
MGQEARGTRKMNTIELQSKIDVLARELSDSGILEARITLHICSGEDIAIGVYGDGINGAYSSGCEWLHDNATAEDAIAAARAFIEALK